MRRLHGVSGSEHRRTRHEYVGTRFDKGFGVANTDASVDFNVGLRGPFFVQQGSKGPRLRVRPLDERLATKTGIHTHQADQIEVVGHVANRLHRRVRVQRHTCLHASCADRAKGTVQVRAGLRVDRQDVGAEVGEGLDVAVGIHNHQVHVERLLRMARNGFHHGHAKTDVGHKHAVHDVEVKPLGGRGVHQFHVALEVGEIGRKKRRCKDVGHGAKVCKRGPFAARGGQRVKKVHLCKVNDRQDTPPPSAPAPRIGRPLVVGLTGGMAAGKSTVARMFRVLGAEVWDADTAAKNLYRTNHGLREAAIARWGDAVALKDENGRAVDLVRTEVAKRVFQDPVDMAWLEAQVHPAVARDFDRWLHRIATTTSTPIVVREAAILYESGSHLTCDVVVTVEADEAVRIERAKARAAKRGEAVPSEQDIRARVKRQATREQRVAKSDFVLENGEGDALMPQVLKTFERLMLRTRR